MHKQCGDRNALAQSTWNTFRASVLNRAAAPAVSKALDDRQPASTKGLQRQMNAMRIPVMRSRPDIAARPPASMITMVP